MDLDFLATAIAGWEERGDLAVGRGIVVGRHEPAAVIGALRVGGRDDGGRVLVEELVEDARWEVRRRYEDEEAAADHVFDRLGSLTTQAYWGDERWDEIRADVHDGAVLRTASLLLWPEGDLRPDRWDLAERLGQLGVSRELFWIDGVDGMVAPDECVLQLHRRAQDEWVIGYDERGSFNETARFSEEADACRRMFRDVFSSGIAVSMGMEREHPTVTPTHRAAIRAALLEALGHLDAAPISPDPA